MRINPLVYSRFYLTFAAVCLSVQVQAGGMDCAISLSFFTHAFHLGMEQVDFCGSVLLLMRPEAWSSKYEPGPLSKQMSAQIPEVGCLRAASLGTFEIGLVAGMGLRYHDDIP